MTETKLLIGSFSSDLYRIADFYSRGSFVNAQRFYREARQWSFKLTNAKLKPYIKKIILDFNHNCSSELTLEKAEKYLMYSILLQNYSLHLK